MAIVETRYVVPGWGSGTLWRYDGAVLAHDFHFEAVSDTFAMLGAATSLEVPSIADVADPRWPRTFEDVDCGDIDTNSAPIAIDRNRCLTPDDPQDDFVVRFRAFLAGGEVTFDDAELDLEWATSFQRSLIGALRAVPRGEVVSYGELAALAGRPQAPRAAGAVCAANRFAFIVPCHRVVAAHGIGGYGTTGVDVKRRLLALEGVDL